MKTSVWILLGVLPRPGQDFLSARKPPWSPANGFLTEDGLYYLVTEDGLYYLSQE